MEILLVIGWLGWEFIKWRAEVKRERQEREARLAKLIHNCAKIGYQIDDNFRRPLKEEHIENLEKEYKAQYQPFVVLEEEAKKIQWQIPYPKRVLTSQELTELAQKLEFYQKWYQNFEKELSQKAFWKNKTIPKPPYSEEDIIRHINDIRSR